MRSPALLFACVCLVGAPPVHAQLAPAPTLQHIVVAPRASAAAVAPGGAVTLWAEVTPKPSIHVYAAGAAAFKPVALVLTPNPLIAAAPPTYPKPDVATAQGSTGNVPAYAKPFRIAVPVTVKGSASRGEMLTVAGVVNYQACDDRLCYPPSSAPVIWTVAIK